MPLGPSQDVRVSLAYDEFNKLEIPVYETGIEPAASLKWTKITLNDVPLLTTARPPLTISIKTTNPAYTVRIPLSRYIIPGPKSIASSDGPRVVPAVSASLLTRKYVTPTPPASANARGDTAVPVKPEERPRCRQCKQLLSDKLPVEGLGTQPDVINRPCKICVYRLEQGVETLHSGGVDKISEAQKKCTAIQQVTLTFAAAKWDNNFELIPVANRIHGIKIISLVPRVQEVGVAGLPYTLERPISFLDADQIGQKLKVRRKERVKSMLDSLDASLGLLSL